MGLYCDWGTEFVIVLHVHSFKLQHVTMLDSTGVEDCLRPGIQLCLRPD